MHVEAALGKAAYLQEQKKDYAQALDVLNTVLSVPATANYLPALIEKAKVDHRLHPVPFNSCLGPDGARRLGAGAGRCIALHTGRPALRRRAGGGHCAPAGPRRTGARGEPFVFTVLCSKILLLVTVNTTAYHVLSFRSASSHSPQAATRLGALIAALDKAEPASHTLYFRFSRLAARLSGRHRLVLQQARTLLERAMGMNPNSAEYLNELGYQLMLAETVGS